MQLRELLESLWRRRVSVGVAVTLGVVAAFLAVFRIELGPRPSIEKRSLETGAGTAQLVLDSPRAPILKAGISLEGLTNRAAVLTNFVQSPPVAQRIAKIVDVPVEQIGTRGAPPAGVSRGREIDADQRATELTAEEAAYRVYAVSARDAPVITLFTRAPDPDGAVRLAHAATVALTTYIEDAEERNGVPAMDRVQVRPLGAPRATWVNRGAQVTLAGLAFIGAAAACALLMAVASRISSAMAADRAKYVPTYHDPPWLDHSTIRR